MANGRARALGGSDPLGPMNRGHLEICQLTRRLGRLLDELAPLADSLEYDSDEASLIRLVRRDWEKARRAGLPALA